MGRARKRSRGDAWMPLWVGDFLRDTGHLSAAEVGAYILLLMAGWTRGGALPADEMRLRSLARLDARSWRASRDTLLAFFYRDGDTYRQRRLDQELAHSQGLVDQRRAAGRASAAQRALNARSTSVAPSVATDAPANAQQTARPSPSPLEIPESSLRDASGPPAAPPAAAHPLLHDVRTALWTEGLARLRRLTGKPDRAARAMLGKLLKRAGDDCALVQAVLVQAEMDRPGMPEPWLLAAIDTRMGRGAAALGRAQAEEPRWGWPSIFERQAEDGVIDIEAEG